MMSWRRGRKERSKLAYAVRGGRERATLRMRYELVNLFAHSLRSRTIISSFRPVESWMQSESKAAPELSSRKLLPGKKKSQSHYTCRLKTNSTGYAYAA